MNGYRICRLQENLNRLGEALTVDGNLNVATLEAVQRFQLNRHQPFNGVDAKVCLDVQKAADSLITQTVDQVLEAQWKQTEQEREKFKQNQSKLLIKTLKTLQLTSIEARHTKLSEVLLQNRLQLINNDLQLELDKLKAQAEFQLKLKEEKAAREKAKQQLEEETAKNLAKLKAQKLAEAEKLKPLFKHAVEDRRKLRRLLNRISRPALVIDGKGKTIVFKAHVNMHTGYGQHAVQIIRDFLSWGYQVKTKALDQRSPFADLPTEIKQTFIPVGADVDCPWELVLHPPNLQPSPNKKVAYFSMWESTKLPPGSAEVLNQAEVVIVPSKWCETCFSASGVRSPIRVAQLGIYTDIFKPVKMKSKGHCVFGAAGRLEGGGKRKGLDDVVDSFLRAFPTEQDVKLKVKCFPDCDIRRIKDPRVEYARVMFTWEEMAKWFAGITCFVSACRGEGFGLMQLQSLAVGRPVITTEFSGLTEFFDNDVGYPLDYTLVPGQGVYENSGDYALPDFKHMEAVLRHVYENRQEAALKGRIGAYRGAQYAWTNASLRLLEILKEFDVV